MFRQSPLLVHSLSVVACLILAPLSGLGQVRESREWKRLSAGDLTVVGNAGPAELRRAATNIEQFRNTIKHVYPGMKLSFSVPTVLVVFRNEADFARYRPRDERGRLQEVGGYFRPAGDVAYLVVPAGDPRQAVTYDALFHEYTHALLHLNLPVLPAWVDEGMAEFYSSFQSDFRDGKSLIGKPPQRVQTLRGQPLLPLAQLLTSEGSYKFMRDSTTVQMFYAQSWALVHYLQMGHNGKRQGQLTNYLKLLKAGRPVTDAVKEAFASTFDELQRELQGYVGRTTFPASLVDPGTAVVAPIVEPMTEADARYVQGDLLLKLGATNDANEEFSKVLAVDPTHANARISKAEILLQQGNADEAITLLQNIAGTNPPDVRARTTLVVALQHAGRYEQAVAMGDETAKLTDGSASMWFAISLAQLALGREADSDSAIARADALMPETRWYRSRAYSAYEAGRHRVVVRDVAAHLDRVGADSDAAPYPAFLGAISYRKLNSPDLSAKMLDRAASAVVSGSWAEQVLWFLQGRSSAADFMRTAKGKDQQTEAHAYIGILLNIAGDRERAEEHLQWVKEKGSRNFVEYRLAVADLEQLARSPK
jgi:tetratricopeptide (TPR) repeat protein